MPQRDDIQFNIGISGVKTILHELHMKVKVTVSEGTLAYERLAGSQNSEVFEGIQRSLFEV